MAAEPSHKTLPSPDCRKRFARTLYLWRIRAGWAQDTLNKWGKAAGFPGMTDAVFNHLENAKSEQPKPLSFIQLAEANDRLARKDYGAIADRKLMDAVKRQEPICHENGTPWIASDFFGHFVGTVPAPAWASEAVAFTPEEAEKFSWQQREMFIRFAQNSLLDRMEAWQQLQQHCTGMSKEQVEAFKLVLGGHRTWTPGELMAMTDESGQNKAMAALQSWCDNSDLCEEFRAMCPD